MEDHYNHIRKIWKKLEDEKDPKNIIELSMEGSTFLSFKLEDNHNSAELLMSAWHKLSELGFEDLKDTFLEKIVTLENYNMLLKQNFFKSWLKKLGVHLDNEKEDLKNANMDKDWYKTKKLKQPAIIKIERKEYDTYEDLVHSVISDIPNGENEFGLGGQNLLSSWIIEEHIGKNIEGVPNASYLGLEFNSSPNCIVDHVLDKKIKVINIKLGDGENFNDGIIDNMEDENVYPNNSNSEK